MNLVLYKTSYRTNDLVAPPTTGGVTVEVQIRGNVTMTSPVMVLRGFDDYYLYNFAYVPKWDRYYFISDWTVDGNLQYLSMTEAYLISWYDEIKNSAFFCTRSASSYDDKITDTFFPAEASTETVFINESSPWSDFTEGNYVIAIASGGNDVPHVGTNCYYILTQSEMTQFMHDLMGTADFSLSGIADSISKTMINPLQYIQSCIWLPFNVQANTVSVSSIDFGWWSSSASAKVINLTSNSDCVTKFETLFPATSDMISAEREYMKHPPYSTLGLTMYPFGQINIPQALMSSYMSGNAITARIFIDNLTGMGSLILTDQTDNPFYLTTANVGVEIPVGQILQDFAGSILQTTGAVTNIASGGITGAASGVYNALNSLAPSVSVSGTAGGIAQLMLDEDFTLSRSYKSVSIDGELVGEPLCSTRLINALSGYAIFYQPEMEGEMLKNEKEAINALLSGGIFIA